MSKLTILGIDPGNSYTGWGALMFDGPQVKLRWGVIHPTHSFRPIRMTIISHEVAALVDRFQPQYVAVEDPFLGHNVHAAIAIGQAQAAAMIGALKRWNEAGGAPEIRQYAPATIKKQVAGSGRADKQQVRNALVGRLGLSDETFTPAADASDALAVGYCAYLELQPQVLGRPVATASA